ncbi:uncharacterized protein TNCV_3494471 [Trichonephila clavipes]|nr:uncharacterized protein TNCV_3494471 [Trichonephila clavipes]
MVKGLRTTPELTPPSLFKLPHPISGKPLSNGRRASASLNAVALSAIQVTERFSSVHPNLEGKHQGGGLGPSTNLTRGLAARRLFKVPPCREGTIHLQTSMSSPGFEPSPSGTAVNVANHYTGWATTSSIKVVKENIPSISVRI